MATTGSNKTEIDQIKTWINSVIQNSLLPAELAAQTEITDISEVSILQKGTDDAKGVATALLRGYQGLWSAATNTPTLIDGTGIELDKFFVSADGSVDLGSGTMSFKVGDRVEFINGIWYKRNGGGIELSLNTGVLTGGEITVNAGDPAKFDVAAGTGYILDWTNPLSPKGTAITWGAFPAQSIPDIATELFTTVSVVESASPGIGELDIESGVVTTPQNRRQEIRLQGFTHVDGATITAIGLGQKPAYEVSEALLDYVIKLGAINEGNQIEENGANLSVNKTTGTTTLPFINKLNNPQNPTELTNVAQIASVHSTFYQDGAGEFIQTPGITDINPEQWDNGTGTLASVANNKFTIKRCYFFGQAETVAISYGQAEYASLALAKTNVFLENPVVSPIFALGVFVTALVIKKGVTDISAAIIAGDAEFISISSFTSSGTGGSIGNFVTQDTNQTTGNVGDKTWSGQWTHEQILLLEKGTGFEAQIGEASTVGGIMYLSSDGKWYNTNANDVAKSSTRIAMSLAVGIADDIIVFLKEGLIDGLSGLTAGDNYYLDITDSLITNDISGFLSGYIGRVAGTAESATELRFDPDVTWIEIF